MPDARDPEVPDEHHVPRTGHWMPQDKRHHHKFLQTTIQHVDEHPKPLHPVIQEFKDAVDTDTRLTMLFTSMFDQASLGTQAIPSNKKYLTDAAGENAQVRDFDHLCELLNHVISTAPHWTDAGHKMGMVGVPINALLDWPMGTTSGFVVFLDPKVNSYLKKILDEWGRFLASPESASVLGTDKQGWFSSHGVASLEEVANKASGTNTPFDQLFHCDPKAEHHGYTSWDNFFTRTYRFEDGIRPIASPEDDSVVANCCESKVYKVAHDAQARERFWVKGQPYSVKDMLAFDDYADQFVGGTIYQAFLSALSYHRWHAPVTGTIKRAYIVPGTYYSEPTYEDFSANQEADPHGENTSQEYISAVAVRSLIFIEADNPKIGLMCVIAVGMTEVSTCEMTVKEGDKVKKGDQLGMFHFGGSTHCVLFRKGVKVSGFPEPSDHNVPVRSKLCHVE